jgi:hypothetical protein
LRSIFSIQTRIPTCSIYSSIIYTINTMLIKANKLSGVDTTNNTNFVVCVPICVIGRNTK